MTRQKTAQIFFLGLCLLVLILDSREALSGCREGISLCLESVIPSLFPFLILCPMFTGLVSSLPGLGIGSFFLTGCLGGYPTGAQCIALATRSGSLSKEDGEHLLLYCCNCGPGFLFGICAGMFQRPWAGWLLWFCHLTGAILMGAALKRNIRLHKNGTTSLSFVDALSKGVKTMAMICGWVVAARCLLSFFSRWLFPFLPLPVSVLLSGILELTAGCFELSKIENEVVRMLLCQTIVSLGGMCVLLQTLGAIKGLHPKYYLAGKLGQTLFSVLLTAAILAALQKKLLITGSLLAFTGIIWMVLRASQKNMWKFRSSRCIIKPSITGRANHAVS